MPTDPSDPSSPKSSTRPYQTTPDAPKGSSGGIFFVILLLLLLGGGAGYYFLVYKPAAAAGATAIAPPPTAAASTPKPMASPAPTPAQPGYNNELRAQYIKQADDAFIALRDAKSGPFTAAINAFVAAGGLKAAGLTSKAAIAARRDLVAKCQTANDDYEAFVKTQDEAVKAELQKTPLKSDDVDYVLSDAVYKVQTPKSVQLRGLQRDSLKCADDMLAYLDKSYGSWSINAAQNLVFKKPADAAPFTALAKSYNEQSVALNKLQAEIKAATDPTIAPTTPAASPAASSSPAVSPAASPAASATP